MNENVDNIIKRNVLIEVFKCVNILAPTNFCNYFERRNHSMATRRNNSLLELPKLKTEIGKKSFKYQGSLLYNKLPKRTRDCTVSVIYLTDK